VLKGRVKGIYLRGHTYWFAKQVNGRRSFVSLETEDYVLAVQRAREIMDSPELQPAQSFIAEVERFLKHKFATNRYSKMSAESKRSCLIMFADSVKDIPPANVTTNAYQIVIRAPLDTPDLHSVAGEREIKVIAQKH